MGKRLIFILCFLFLFTFVSAVPPVTTIHQFSTGYTIQVHPIRQYFEAGQDVNFHVHIYNTTNGYPINESLTCNFHLYNNTGHKLTLSSNTASGDYDYEFYVKGGNFTSDVKSYNIFCYDGDQGGNYPYAIEVNSVGRGLTVEKSVLYIGLLAIMVLIFFLNFIGMSYLPSKNTRDEEGKLMSISYLKYFRNVLWVTGYFLFIAILFLASNVAFAYLGEEMFGQILFTLFKISFGLAPVIIIIWLIWIFASIFHDRQFQKLLNRGIFPGEQL